jgi:hypothetical protein
VQFGFGMFSPAKRRKRVKDGRSNQNVRAAITHFQTSFLHMFALPSFDTPQKSLLGV